MIMNGIGLTPTFNKSLARLTNKEQALVKQVPIDFMLNPSRPGHRLHKLKTKENRFLSISVSMDLRIIVLRDKHRILFCYVGHHDDAYAWANRRRVEVHPSTGSAQLVELEEVVRENIIYAQRGMNTPPIFANEDGKYLAALGVPEAWISAIKQVDTDGFFEIADRLPGEAAEALMTLAAGDRPTPPQAWTKRDKTKTRDPFVHPDAQRRFWVTTNERILKQALDYPWEQWTIFLHPSQRDAVERNFGGPARVSGSAGTGKTIVALHRSVFLATKFKDANVLLTTYSRPLVTALEEGLNKLVGATGDVRRRIRVEHLHKLAHEIASESPGFSFAPVRPQELDVFIDTALSRHPTIDVSKAFVRSEFDAVVDYWGIMNPLDYQEIDRSGRRSALSPERRAEIWPIFDDVLEQMRESQRMTWSDLADAARLKVEAFSDLPFQHVVADEAQDFGPRELRFVMSLAPLNAHSHFFTGDSSQRIYRYPFAWLRAGVDVRGRGAALVVNYRTTNQIRDFAARTIGCIEPDDEEEFSVGEPVSIMSGPVPVVEHCDTPEDEARRLAAWLEILRKQGVLISETAVFARTVRLLDQRVAPALEMSKIPANIIGSSRRKHTGGISIGTLHNAKGLEFRAVAIVASDAEFLPHPSVIASADDKDGRVIAETRERHLFYVGCTRAREILRISYCGEPTRFLK